MALHVASTFESDFAATCFAFQPSRATSQYTMINIRQEDLRSYLGLGSVDRGLARDMPLVKSGLMDGRLSPFSERGVEIHKSDPFVDEYVAGEGKWSIGVSTTSEKKVEHSEC